MASKAVKIGGYLASADFQNLPQGVVITLSISGASMSQRLFEKLLAEEPTLKVICWQGKAPEEARR